MTIPEVLNKAADLLERDGWCQRSALRGNQRCVVRAIQDCSRSEWLLSEAVRIFENHTGWHPSLIIWNDAPSRTAEEVIGALRQAAKEYERDHAIRSQSRHYGY